MLRSRSHAAHSPVQQTLNCSFAITTNQPYICLQGDLLRIKSKALVLVKMLNFSSVLGTGKDKNDWGKHLS